MRSENDALAEAIRNEMRRYEESYRSDYEIAVSRENAIRASLAQQFEKTLAIGDKQVKLNELDSTVKTLRTSYEAALQRFTDSVQKMSFPVSEARIISNALPPTGMFRA
jgi:succinoglycan biosynthesis transport protein ExoP